MTRMSLLEIVILSLATGCSSGASDDAALTGSADPNQPSGDFGAPVTKSTPSEPCTAANATRACCGTGTQTCSGPGEFKSWGACVDAKGAPLTCNGNGTTPSGDPNENESGGGTGDGGTSGDGAPAKSDTTTAGACKAGMECKPGAIRYCDDSKIAEWTKSTCDANGKWGPCVETTAPKGNGCDPDSYSPEKCCPPLKLCCQDNSGGAFVDFGSGGCAATKCP